MVTCDSIDMKVSMPMGSLCPNHNIIGTVLVARPSLKQEDFVMVVLLAMLLANVVHKDLSLSSNTTHPTTLKTTLLLPTTQKNKGGGGSIRWMINLTN